LASGGDYVIASAGPSPVEVLQKSTNFGLPLIVDPNDPPPGPGVWPPYKPENNNNDPIPPNNDPVEDYTPSEPGIFGYPNEDIA
jgi:hypothetical protein